MELKAVVTFAVSAKAATIPHGSKTDTGTISWKAGKRNGNSRNLSSALSLTRTTQT